MNEKLYNLAEPLCHILFELAGVKLTYHDIPIYVNFISKNKKLESDLLQKYQEITKNYKEIVILNKKYIELREILNNGVISENNLKERQIEYWKTLSWY